MSSLGSLSSLSSLGSLGSLSSFGSLGSLSSMFVRWLTGAVALENYNHEVYIFWVLFLMFNLTKLKLNSYRYTTRFALHHMYS